MAGNEHSGMAGKKYHAGMAGHEHADVASGDRARASAITGVVDRPRLYSILSSPLVRVCVVHGPSGAGKTTLLRSWALQYEEYDTVAWVSLGAGITTRQAFWLHVVASAERLGEMSKGTAEEVRRQLGGAVDPVRIASPMLAAAGQVILVLDAYEHLGEVAAEIDNDLARLLATVPTLRVMVTTRGQTALTELALRDGVTRVITLSDLSFTADEVSQLLVEQAGIDDERLALSVTGATRGFPVTVRAVALAIAQLGRIPRADPGEWDRIVAARLEGLLPDAAAAQFVTDTSVPPYVDEGLARLLSENPETPELLKLLERNGFGRWIPYGRNRPVFQYVEMIRDTFRERAAADPERFRQACVVTALWLLENEEIVDQALQFAIEAGDYALADRVFVSVVISNIDSYTSDRFLPVLQQVPDAVLHDYPMLAFGLGLARMSNVALRLEAPRAFRIAIDSPAHPPYLEPAIDAFSHAGMRAVSRRLALDFPASAAASIEVARSVDALAPELLVRYGEHVGTILRQLSFSIWLGGAIEEAVVTADRSVALCTKPTARNYSISYSAAINAFAGDTVQAAALGPSIDGQAWAAESRATAMNAMGILAEAYIRLDTLDFSAAAAVLRESGANLRTSEYWPFLTAAGVITRHGLGHARVEAERVGAELDRPSPPPGVGENTGTDHLYAVLAQSWMASGDHRAAARMLDRGTPDSPYLAAARLAWQLGTGREHAALRQAREALLLPGHTIRTRAEVQTWGAAAALRQGDSDLAWEWLGAAGVAWETYGPRLHLAFLEPRDRRLLWTFSQDRAASELQRYLDIPASPVQLGRAVELSRREQIVLAQLAEHDSIRAVAEALSVSPHTIKTQQQSIYRKLGVTSRRSAIEVARELGLLRPPG
ncbi:MAG: LuxR C-terminal-related transcriptional regulator [Microlunatus sp.]